MKDGKGEAKTKLEAAADGLRRIGCAVMLIGAGLLLLGVGSAILLAR